MKESTQGRQNGPYAGLLWNGSSWIDSQGNVADGAALARQATPDSREAVPTWSLIMMGALTTLGLATVVMSFLATPTCTQYGAAFNCDEKVISSPAMWLAWVVLVALAGCATSLNRRTARGRRGVGPPLLMLGVLLAWCAVAILFPPVTAILNAMNAGL